MSPITELSKYQFDMMDMMANAPAARVLSLLHPREDDSTQRYKELNDQHEQLKALVDLGLVRDVSGQYQLIREAARNQHGRDLSMFELTSIGQQMFEDYGKRKAN